MKVTEKGVKFVAAHEGWVGKAYRDPVGILTIGYGFTNSSQTTKKFLGKIKPGSRVSRETGLKMLKYALDHEYGPKAERGLPGATQHEFEAATSGCFNVGARIFKWTWAKMWRAGDKAGAWHRWLTTATTARGRSLPGLIKRRAHEVNLAVHGKYHGAMPAFKPARKVAARPDDTLEEYQAKLKKLGYYDGDIDGLRGPQTTAAVKAFQVDDAHLENDGVLGRATMESIDRHLKTKGTINHSGIMTAVSTASTASGYLDFLPKYVMYGGFAIIGLIVIYLIWRYRGWLLDQFEQLTGAEA